MTGDQDSVASILASSYYRRTGRGSENEDTASEERLGQYTVLEIKAFVMCGDGDFQCSDGDTKNRNA